MMYRGQLLVGIEGTTRESEIGRLQGEECMQEVV